jgi:GTPase Era involved in 16S rRNA processing
MLTWYMLLELTQSAVVRINKKDQTHQVVFKSIGHYATDVYFHHVRIPVNLSNVIETPKKAMQTIEAYIKNVYQSLLMYYNHYQRSNIADKHQAHLAAQLIKDSSHFIMNMSSDELVSILFFVSYRCQFLRCSSLFWFSRPLGPFLIPELISYRQL